MRYDKRRSRSASIIWKTILKHTAVFAAAAILARSALGQDVPNKFASMTGSWQVDNRRSDSRLTTEATTDYGKTKINLTLGFARVNGIVKIDEKDPAKSSVDLAIYPATSISPSIDEEGIFLSDWLASRSPHHMLVCFHSRRVLRTPGGLQATGELSLTRVERSIEGPNEGLSEVQADPPSVIHRTSHEVTLVFDFPAGASNMLKDGGIQASGTTTVSSEDFSQIVSTAVSTYWPPLVQEENCEVPIANELNGSSQCTGTFLKTPEPRKAPEAANRQDFHGSQKFNAIVGEHLTILVLMRSMPKASAGRAAVGN